MHILYGQTIRLDPDAGKERMIVDNRLFRKESLERFSSPESLHDYLRVTSPKLWMVLVAVFSLAAGFILYASTATMEETLPVRVQVEVFDFESEPLSLVSIELPPDRKGLVQTGMPVRFDGKTGKVETIYEVKDAIGILVTMDKPDEVLVKGDYDGVVVTESTTPVGFLLQ